MPRNRMIKTEFSEKEFIGFFFGEGHLDLIKIGRTTRSLTPRARIALRDDDVAVLEWIKDYFGGYFTHRTKFKNGGCPATCWTLSGKSKMEKLISVLKKGKMPSKKMLEVDIIEEALTLVPIRGKHQTDENVEILQNLKSELIFLRKYKYAQK